VTASDRLFLGSADAGGRRKISKPARAPPRFLPALAMPATRAPRGLLKTVRPILGRLPAAALHHQSGDGLAAQCLSWCPMGQAIMRAMSAPSPSPPRTRNRRPGLPLCPTISTGSAAGSVRLCPCSRRPPGPRLSPQQAAKPDADGLPPQAEPDVAAATPSDWRGRPREPPADGRPRHQAALERGPDGRKLSAKQKLKAKEQAGQ